MNNNLLDECIICYTPYSQNHIVLNCLHKLCINCYNRIITDDELLQKCPICRHDIFENINDILYIPIDNLESANFENNYRFNCNKFIMILKNILVFSFILFICIALIILLGIISKILYK